MVRKYFTQTNFFRILAVIIGSVLVSLFFTLLKVTVQQDIYSSADYWPLAIFMMARVWIWLLLTFIIIIFSKRFPFKENVWKTSLIYHIIFSFVISTVFCFLNYAVTNFLFVYYFNVGARWTIESTFSVFFRYSILIYFLIASVYFVYDYYKQYKFSRKEAEKLELKNLKLETLLTQSQINTLKMQLRPHFLFNTLHTVNGLISSDAASAKRVVTLLSDLLRASLQFDNEHIIMLKEELEFIKKYIEIQQIRFQERLTVEYEILEETFDASVPVFIFQPMIENAIEHGISSDNKSGIIKIVSTKEDGDLVLQIHNSGFLKKPADEIFSSDGIGIKNTKERLLHLYQNNQSIQFEQSYLGGLLVKIKIPFINHLH